MYATNLSQAPDPLFCKCWADATLPNGEASGESCNRVAVTLMGLCGEHYLTICGREAHALPQAA